MRVTVKADRLRAQLREARRRSIDLGPAFESIGEEMLISTRKTFEAEGRPSRWEALTPAYRKARPSGRILTVRGTAGGLRGSITKKTGKTFAQVGTNKVYAAIHQFGGKTKPHVIRPRRKKALHWPGAAHPVRKVNHPGSKIPARPYLLIQDEDWTEFESILQDYIVGVLGGR